MHWYGGGGMGTFGLVGTVALWVLLLALVVWAVTKVLPGTGSSNDPVTGPVTGPGGESALEALDRRFARGELGVEAWQSARAALLIASGGAT